MEATAQKRIFVVTAAGPVVVFRVWQSVTVQVAWSCSHHGVAGSCFRSPDCMKTSHPGSRTLCPLLVTGHAHLCFELLFSCVNPKHERPYYGLRAEIPLKGSDLKGSVTLFTESQVCSCFAEPAWKEKKEWLIRFFFVFHCGASFPNTAGRKPVNIPTTITLTFVRTFPLESHYKTHRHPSQRKKHIWCLSGDIK